MVPHVSPSCIVKIVLVQITLQTHGLPLNPSQNGLGLSAQMSEGARGQQRETRSHAIEPSPFIPSCLLRVIYGKGYDISR